MTEKQIIELHRRTEDIFKKYPTIRLHRRKINNKGRKEAGYIFHGNHKYLAVGLCYGDDKLSKVPSILFENTFNQRISLDIIARDPQYYAPQDLIQLAQELKMIKVEEGRYRKYFHGTWEGAISQLAALYPIIEKWLSMHEVQS